MKVQTLLEMDVPKREVAKILGVTTRTVSKARNGQKLARERVNWDGDVDLSREQVVLLERCLQSQQELARRRELEQKYHEGVVLLARALDEEEEIVPKNLDEYATYRAKVLVTEKISKTLSSVCSVLNKKLPPKLRRQERDARQMRKKYHKEMEACVS